jgi:hypothetical protein
MDLSNRRRPHYADPTGRAARLFTISPATIGDIDEILRCLRAAFAPYRTQYTPAAYEGYRHDCR